MEGFIYEVWLEGNCLHTEDCIFDSVEDAEEDARVWIQDTLNDWQDENYSEDDFEIKVSEYAEEIIY